jgi:hypothetical protein
MKLTSALCLALLPLVLPGVLSCGPKDIKSDAQIPQVVLANEIAVIGRLSSIVQAQFLYQIESGGSFGTLEQLVETRIMRDPSTGQLSGYAFEIKVKEAGFEVTATPKNYPITGRRSFFADETRVIRGVDKKGAPATASDPTV